MARFVLICVASAGLALLAAAGCSREGHPGDQRLDDFFILRHPELPEGAPVVAVTGLLCAAPVAGEIRLGSRWGSEIWLDGRRLHAGRQRRATPTALDERRLPMALARGRHRLVVRFLNGPTPALDDRRIASTDAGFVLRFADETGRALAGLALVAPGGVPGIHTWALARGKRTATAGSPARRGGPASGASGAVGTRGWRGVASPPAELAEVAELIETPLRPLAIGPVPVVFYVDELRRYPLHGLVQRSATTAVIELDWRQAFGDSIHSFRVERTARWHQRVPVPWTTVARSSARSLTDRIDLDTAAWPWTLGTGMGRIITYRITPDPPRALDWAAPRLISVQVLAPGFHDLDQVQQVLRTAARDHPEVVELQEIGRSAWGAQPILAARLSGPGEAMRPAVLVVGDIHAREPFGIEIGVDLVRNMSRDYGQDPDVTRLLDATELWVVPVLNSGAWSAVSHGFPGYVRKNASDQNGDGCVTPSPLYPIEWSKEPLLAPIEHALYLEGVDLNRNFDPAWDSRLGDNAGSDDPAMHKYRGRSPFSEPETRAIRDLALRERFVFSLFYHEPGELFYFLRGTADDALFEQAADRIGRARRKSVGVWGGCSLGFMYNETGAIDFTVEGATDVRGDAEWLLAPTLAARDSVSAHHQAIVHELMRWAAGRGLHGLVVDRDSGRPLPAELEITGIDEAGGASRPQLRAGASGRFHRMLPPGLYRLRARLAASGAETMRTVRIVAERPTQVVLRLDGSGLAGGRSPRRVGAPPGAAAD